MADRQGGERELVFCHQCENEWYREEHGLQCPECESEFVEVIERDHDPRAEDENPDSADPYAHDSPQHPLHNHNPWTDTGAPDPDEGDVDHVEWNRGGVHFRSTTIHSPPVRISLNGGPGASGAPESILSLLGQALGGLGAPNVPPRPNNTQAPTQPNREQPGQPATFGFGLTSPLREGPPLPGQSRTFSATIGFGPRNGDGGQPQTMNYENLPSLLGSLFGPHGIGGMPQPGQSSQPGDGATPLNPLAFLARMLDPSNQRAGDAVYSQEAFDRVMSQLMEQHRGSSAPGPASSEAIAALPKVLVETSMMGDNGKAECSVCMDGVELGDQVTMLPCKHWFHGDCVGAWLSEHDTCPHCRQSITPKEGSTNVPRSPGQAPMHSPTWGSDVENGGTTASTSATTAEQQRPQSGGEGNGPTSPGASGITGWLGRRLGGGGSTS
ncbi:hypothetical protein MMC25_007605 [Agyrium rufum]|nr:hypothetical protein [Agyrium rufum]